MLGLDASRINETQLLEALPDWLRDAITQMQQEWAKIDAGEPSNRWDIAFGILQSYINVAEVERLIDAGTARYLREEYLDLEI